MNTAIAIPTVHLNGSSQAALTEGYAAASAALRKTIDAVQVTAPHARDYYLQGDSAYAVAAREHADRLMQLNKILNDMRTLANGVANQSRTKR